MENVVNIVINPELCKGCKLCVRTCYEDVYRWDEKEKKPIVAYPEDCVMCLQCEMACSAKCLEVFPPRDAHGVNPFG